MLKYYAFRLAGALIPRMPQSLGYTLAGLLAWVISALPLSVNRALRANLRQVLGAEASEVEVRRFARGALRTGVINYYEMFLMSGLSLEEINARASIHDIERGYRALAAGKGVIATSPHFGSFNLISRLSSYYQVPLTIVVEDLKPRRFHDYVAHLRASHGIRLVPAGRSLRSIVRALHANEIVALGADRDVTGGGKWLPFFGTPTRIPVGQVKLALRTGAPILPCFVVRESEQHYGVHFEEPLFLEPTGDQERDVREGAQRIVALMERYIRAHPDQWMAFQPIWNHDGPMEGNP